MAMSLPGARSVRQLLGQGHDTCREEAQAGGYERGIRTKRLLFSLVLCGLNKGVEIVHKSTQRQGLPYLFRAIHVELPVQAWLLQPTRRRRRHAVTGLEMILNRHARGFYSHAGC